MKQVYRAIGAIALVVSSFAASAQEPPAPTAAASMPLTADQLRAACLSSFMIEGSFMSGRRFKISVEAPVVTVPTAVTSVAQTLALEGKWKNIQANADVGTVTAVRDIPGGKKQTPLSAIVKARQPDGVKLEVVSTTPAMIMSSEEGYKLALCDLAASLGS